jgi:hypothetical protein
VQPPSDDRSPTEPIDSTASIVAMLAAAGALVATWNVPILGVIVAWPFLFFIPGWVMVRRIAPDLPRPGSVGVAVVTSVVLSTHLVSVVGHLADVGRAAVLVTTVGLATATVVFARLRHRWLAPLVLPSPRAFPGALRHALREDAAAWTVAALVTFVVLDILWVNGWRETPDGFVSGGWNWSDLLVHVAIGNSIIHGNFPPEVPYFAGEPLSYHWFADFHGAIAATAADLPIIPVFFVSSALMAGVLALVVWALAWSISWRRDVALIATVLVCVTGGMGWLRLVGDALGGTASISELVVQNPYDNSWADTWPFFRIASIFGTGFLPHRATTFGLPGLVAVVLLVVTCWGRRPGGVLLAGILAALLAPFHFYAFPATYLIVGLYVLATDRWRDPALPRDALLFLTPIVLAMPYVLPAALRQGAEGSFRFVLGWGEARVADGPAAVAFFYLTNLGIPTLLAIASFLLLRGRDAVPTRGFLAAWIVALFLVPNLVVVSAVEFDMNKYFQMMWIPVAIAGAWLLARWPRPIAIAVVAASAISPALIAVHHATHPAIVMTGAQEEAARWIETNTPDRAIFATDDFINNPVDLAGRLRITTFGPYVSNLGYDPEPRSVDIAAIYCEGPEVAAKRMERYRATYVLSSGGALACDEPTDFGSSPLFETVYEADGVSVWRLVGA